MPNKKNPTLDETIANWLNISSRVCVSQWNILFPTFRVHGFSLEAISSPKIELLATCLNQYRIPRAAVTSSFRLSWVFLQQKDEEDEGRCPTAETVF